MNKNLVDEFLMWELPKTVSSDFCVTKYDYEHPRYGTNMLNEKEAGKLVSHLLTNLIGTIGDMTPVFFMLQREEISTGKAREYLDAWRGFVGNLMLHLNVTVDR